MGFAMNVPSHTIVKVLVTILLRTQEQILVAMHALMVLLVQLEALNHRIALKLLVSVVVTVNASQERVKIKIVAQVQWVAMFAMPTALAQRVPQIITHRTINALLVLLV